MHFWHQKDFNGWPPGISNGLASCCQKCGGHPGFDFQVDDDAWRAIAPAQMRAGVICLPCLDTLAEEVGIDACQHLREVQFSGRQSTVVLVPAMVVTLSK